MLDEDASMFESSAHRRLPPWLKISTRGAAEREQVRRMLGDLELNTVCQSAMCPNMCECWAKGTATVMILGDHCTRNCRFCAVPHVGAPAPPDPEEPERVAKAAERMNLKFVVVTSVTRDDLSDGGAAHFAAVIRAVRGRMPRAGIEVLTPDFGGRHEDVQTVLAEEPTVFNHNIETCERLTEAIRSGADYRRSLDVLMFASEAAADSVRTKSGIMLGLGETDEEIREIFADLRRSGVRILTIGQYLPPSKSHWPVDRYVTPEEFDEWGRVAREEYGFSSVASAPFVRSSYMAEQFADFSVETADQAS